MFKHFIITQFNVKFRWSGWNKVCDVPDSNWLHYRLEIFKKYTYPSIVNQTNQNFEWLVFFDDSTDRSLLSSFKRITPIFLKNYDRWTPEHVSAAIKSKTSNEDKWIITSILDCDDVYHPNMIKRVQENFKPEEFIIDFKDGININIINKKATIFKYKCPSPYLSLVEENKNNLKTCKYVQHPGMGKYFKEFSISNELMWAMVVHGNNINNKMRGLRFNKTNIINSFGVF
jgi:glycosyltransferase involved in cell wall biosynthesis